MVGMRCQPQWANHNGANPWSGGDHWGAGVSDEDECYVIWQCVSKLNVGLCARFYRLNPKPYMAVWAHAIAWQ